MNARDLKEQLALLFYAPLDSTMLVERSYDPDYRSLKSAKQFNFYVVLQDVISKVGAYAETNEEVNKNIETLTDKEFKEMIHVFNPEIDTDKADQYIGTNNLVLLKKYLELIADAWEKLVGETSETPLTFGEKERYQSFMAQAPELLRQGQKFFQNNIDISSATGFQPDVYETFVVEHLGIVIPQLEAITKTLMGKPKE